MTEAERQFNRARKQFVWLCILWVPTSATVAYFTPTFGSVWPFWIVVVSYILMMVYVGVRYFAAFNRMKNSN
jgi:hypothetical protein